MAHHKSAKKRIRSNEKKNLRNSAYLSSVRTAIKKFRKAASTSDDKSTTEKLFTSAQALLSKAANKGIIHKNNASRRVSRLAAVMKLVQEGKKVPMETAVRKKRSGAQKAALRKAKQSATGTTKA